MSITNKPHPKVVIIDGLSLAYRAFFSTINQLDYFHEHQLPPTNGLRMMIIMVAKILSKHNYQYGLVAFDQSRKSFRTDLFADYKAKRKPMHLELQEQIEPIYQALSLMGLKTLSLANYEADDLIGSFSHLCAKQQLAVDIYTSDQDFLQLVTPEITVNLLKKGVSDIVVHDWEHFLTLNEGLMPPQIVDLKALAGDGSDNYPGVSGIGKKTALKLLQEYQSVNEIYANLQQLKPNLQAKLAPASEQVKLYQTIAKIHHDVFIEPDLNHYLIQPGTINEIDQFLTKWKLPNLKKYFYFN